MLTTYRYFSFPQRKVNTPWCCAGRDREEREREKQREKQRERERERDKKKYTNGRNKECENLPVRQQN